MSGSSDLFPRAKRVGLAEVRSWLPEGRQEGDEWVVRNPTRADHKAGSFKINLETGQWSDFARPDEASGNDAVSLYAYLNWSRLEQLAREREYKNLRGGVMTEAAREILVNHDPTYFPSDNDRFDVPKQSNGGGSSYWDGWHEVPRGIDNPPELDTSWHEKQWGDRVASWEFERSARTVMIVCRFRTAEGKKEDRPFTLWTNGSEYRWRAKAPSGAYALWNADALVAEPNAPVILTEGQKAAAVLQGVLDDYVCTGWYGGTNAVDKQDWEPLRGREVWFPFDADSSGRKSLAAIRSVAEQYDIKLHPVYPPAGVEKGWDIADAVDAGWTVEEIREHLTGGGTQTSYIDDESAYTFEILGYHGEHVVFYPHGSRRITRYRANALTKNALMTLMDRSLWGRYYAKDDGGIAWDAAVNDLLRKAEEKPMFSFSRCRGTGVWRDNGQIVVNTGEYLIVDGEQKPLYSSDGDYVYERGVFVPYGTEPPLPVEEAGKVREMLELVDWRYSFYADVLAGWLTLAPFGGALNWRPYVWLTGPAGGGKSWILDNIAYPLVGKEFGIYTKGTATPAGIRNRLANNSVPTQADEMESDNQKLAENIEQNVRMFREGNSGDGGAATLHGTQDGEGREWRVQSMALFASVGAAIQHGADKSRFTEISLGGRGTADDIQDREARFKRLEELSQVLTKPWARAYHARTYALWAEVERCIMIMTQQATEILGSRRHGDQIGTLIAGAWMSRHDEAASAAEARQYLEQMEVADLVGGAASKSDEELVLDEILSARIELTGGGGTVRTTIGAALTRWFSDQMELEDTATLSGVYEHQIREGLAQYGVKPKAVDGQYTIQIADAHPAIRKMLRDTPWAVIYNTLIARLSCCLSGRGPGKFAGMNKRYRELDAREVLDTVPF